MGAGELENRCGESKDRDACLDRLQKYRRRSVELFARMVQVAPDDSIKQYLPHSYLDPVRDTENSAGWSRWMASTVDMRPCGCRLWEGHLR